MATYNFASVNDSATSVALAAENLGRLGLFLHNDSSEILYVGLGVTPTVTSFNAKVAAGASWEMPKPVFQGAVNGIWANNSTGAARITEIV